MNEIWYIYLNCYETSGYFTGIVMNSVGQEVGVHPYRTRAYRFNSKNDAFNMARTLKMRFSCIKNYDIRNY